MQAKSHVWAAFAHQSLALAAKSSSFEGCCRPFDRTAAPLASIARLPLRRLEKALLAKAVCLVRLLVRVLRRVRAGAIIPSENGHNGLTKRALAKAHRVRPAPSSETNSKERRARSSCSICDVFSIAALPWRQAQARPAVLCALARTLSRPRKAAGQIGSICPRRGPRPRRGSFGN